MKIVIATPLYPPEIGGPATYAQLLMEHLPQRGIEAELVTFSSVRHLPKGLRHLAYFWRVYIAARRAAAVLALDPVSVGVPALGAAKLRGAKFIVRIAGDYAWEQGRQRFGVTEELDAFVGRPQPSFFVRLFQRIQTFVARAAAQIIVPSEYLKRIVAAWGLRPEQIRVIYNAVSVGSPGAVPAVISKSKGKIVLTAGRLVPWKGIDGLIDAVSSMRAAHPNLLLVIAGDGPQRQVLEKRAEEKLKIGYVFTGALPHAELIAVLRLATVFVLNSSYEGLSHLLIEAVMLGVPIVATDIPGNVEVIAHEKNGLLVPPKDSHQLASAINRLLSDGVLRARFKKQNEEQAKRFSEERMIESVVNLLTAL